MSTNPSSARYTLTWQDALAYEKLPKAMPGLQKATFYIWLALAGILLIALPPELVGDAGTTRFWLTGAALLLAQYAIFRLARATMRLNRARFRYPTPVEVELEQEPDHLLVIENGKARKIRFEDIGMMLPTANHLFMSVGRDLVIVPLVAFGDAEGMQELVGAVDTYMRHHYAADFADADGIVVTDDPGLDHPHHGG